MKEGFGMKIKIKQNVLVENLNYVIRGVSSKNLIHILNCIIIILITIITRLIITC